MLTLTIFIYFISSVIFFFYQLEIHPRTRNLNHALARICYILMIMDDWDVLSMNKSSNHSDSLLVDLYPYILKG